MSTGGGSDGRAYYPELDGLRFLAFLLVFGFHGGMPWVSEAVSWLTLPAFMVTLPFGPGVSDRIALAGPWVARALRMNGWVGVQLFFILSGYLITTLLLREEERFGRVDLRAFWVRRVLRIWPVFYLTVVATFFVLPWLDGRLRDPHHAAVVRTHLPWFVGFVGNWSMIRFGTVGDDAVSILWSVCVEEQFYLLCPLIVAVLRPSHRLTAVLGLMALAIGWRYRLASGAPEQLTIQYDTLAQLDTIAAGVALALWLNRRSGPIRLPRLSGWAVGVAAVLVLGKSELAHNTVGRRVWDFVLIWAVGMAVVAYPVVRDGRARRLLATPALVWLGRISYGLYMYHEIAFWAVGQGHAWSAFRGTMGSFVALGLTIGLASASYYGVERPFLRLKRRWTRVPSRPL